MKRYNAPWGLLLILISSIATGLCLVCVLFWLFKRGDIGNWMMAFPLIILLCAPFTIRGYTLDKDSILIHRMFWNTRLSLSGLQSTRYEPDAMRRSIRLCGNGGLFSFTGWFWNKQLGKYRAFVTDPNHPVVLCFPKRNILISPATPVEFVEETAKTIS